MGAVNGRPLPQPYAPSILIVADDPDIRWLCQSSLEEFGYFVAQASSGREAICAVKEHYFDLMLLDLSLPSQDAIPLIVAAHAACPWLNVIVIFGFMEESLVRVAETMGASGTLNKALAPQILLPTVCKVLATGSMENPRGAL